MFTPLNNDLNRNKEIEKEAKHIKKLYYHSIINRRYPIKYEVKNKENLGFFSLVKEYSYVNLLNEEKEIKDEDKIINYEKPLLLYIEILIERKEFIKAKKLLNTTIKNKFICNKLYELKKQLRKKYAL